MRQYNRAKEQQGSDFSYQTLKTCYLIVLMENSPEILSEVSPEYLHIRSQDYSSGARIKSISDIRFVSLDTYNKVSQNKPIDTSLDAWLTFLSARDYSRINELITKFPEFIPLYQEIAEFRRKPKELIDMYLSSFAQTDRAEERYIVNEMKKEIKEKDEVIAKKDEDLAKKDEDLAKKDEDLAKKDEIIAEKDKLIKQLQEKLNRK